MKDLEKVNASQLFSFWKNLSVGLLVMMGTLFLSWAFPFYFSPIIGLLAAAFLYTMLYNNKMRPSSTCMVVPYAMFYCMIVYAFLSIILNVLDIWSVISVPKELSFFNDPYIPALLLDPVCLLVMVVFYTRRNKLAICIDCKITKGLAIERGRLGEILSSESRLQLVNLIWLFAVLSVIIWVYYFVWYYTFTLINSRDWYIFVWINIIAFILDELYFASRYFNIYLDLKENGEIITEEELSDMTTKTYLRFYVICGNRIFVNTRVADASESNRFMLDTPFVTKRNVNGITTGEVHGIIQRLTGVMNGELRFFYGRKSPDLAKHRNLRYFYFLDGSPDEFEMSLDGEWMDFEALKVIYNECPTSISTTMLTDISRMVTVILTQKLFDDRGYRKMKIKSYKPTFDLLELREHKYDFQDDKWLRIAMYNSDLRGFHIRKWWDRMKKNNPGSRNKDNQWQRRR